MSHPPLSPAHPSTSEVDEKGRKIYRCGNLVYTKVGLITLFAWMLWGSFIYNFMEMVVPEVLPLKLNQLGASSTIIGLVLTSLPSFFNTTLCPWISFKSDRYRSKWGRRIPFILGTLPFLSFSLVFIGISDSLGNWLHQNVFSGSGFGQTTVIIALIAFFAGIFDLFNVFVSNLYWYLFNDVVPDRVMSRFVSYFRLVGNLVGAGFTWFLYKYLVSHATEIFVAAGVLYFVGFGLMCLKVKEREYPPPPEDGEKPSFLENVKIFSKECFSIRYYWDIFLLACTNGMAACIGSFGALFYLSLNLTMDQIGKVRSFTLMGTSIFLLFMGSFVDKWNPVRVSMYLAPLVVIIALTNCVWIFSSTPDTNLFFWATVVFSVFWSLETAVMNISITTRSMVLLPKDKYGQFAGAQGMLVSVARMFGGILIGLFLDSIKLVYPEGNFVYRFSYVWALFFFTIGFYFQYRTYRAWKRLGGEDEYVAPTQNFSVKALLSRAPAERDVQRSRVYYGLATMFLIGLLGRLIYDLAFWYHFGFTAPHTPSFIAFSICTGLIVLTMIFYIPILRYIERP